ncbi:D-hexose-6-phosphate mutarotase [uncultured Paraglaciecola sp.]|jgi:glucose-6-phosphate 1-epimerase|uniref:D-hexose-6-phosphate mutarotase n=1 Tax=uncultured Paraglaciecola sp. TaxID=1765024 RepID=UPI00260040D6|nr:D-hexose-6-phosphate mutarotase [uncultured Paraglaciecola sp.]
MLLTDSINIQTRDNIQLLHINNAFATAEISLFGGHILSFTPKHDNRDRLWLSKKAIFDGTTAIRGGIPVCWPWFGAHKSNSDLAAHGYVRTQTWDILNTEETDTGTIIKLTPQTSIGEGLEGKAQLTLEVHVGQQLKIQLHTTNIGDSPLTYDCALHSYFTISNITQCELFGLSEQYSDKTRDYQLFETPKPYRFNEETDRVHLETPSTLTIIDKQIKTDIQSTGHDSIVVWNPWQDKSINMLDMENDSYLTMLCVETAITKSQTVNPNETHVLEQIII